ncbi:glycosyltransferase [Gordonia hongkongensis]|nr:glycosyltransferase [Gordonia hongkongensis]UPG69934.1 glycosyltransferase [Gordonia hongkongensis]
MRISFVINGTRGDVQPATVLARALARRGHDVRLGLPPNMIGAALDWADGIAGLEVVRLGLDTRAHLESVARARKQAGRHPLRRLRVLLSLRNAGWDQLVSDMAEVVDGADVIVTGLITEQPALAFAESAGVPLISLHHAPVRRNSRVAPVPGHLPGGPRAVRTQWAAYDAAFAVLTRRRERRLRMHLGSPGSSASYAARLRAAPGLELQAYDPMFGVEHERRWTADSEVRRRPTVGFLGSPADHPVTGSDALASWLDAGDAPIYVGFGSMPLRGRLPPCASSPNSVGGSVDASWCAPAGPSWTRRFGPRSHPGRCGSSPRSITARSSADARWWSTTAAPEPRRPFCARAGRRSSAGTARISRSGAPNSNAWGSAWRCRWPARDRTWTWTG